MLEFITFVYSFIPLSATNPWLESTALWLSFMIAILMRKLWLLIPLAIICILHAFHYTDDLLHIETSEPALSLLMGLIPGALCFYYPEIAKRLLRGVYFAIIVKLFLMKQTVINTSVDAVFLACLLPFVRSWFKVIPLAAILWSGSSIGMACAAISLAMVYRSYWLYSCLLVLTLIGLAVFLPSFQSRLASLLNDGGRWRFFEMILQEWASSGRQMLGLGPDSFAYWSSQLQLHHKMNDFGLMIWAHQDYLQILVEYGVIGLLLVLAMMGRALFSARADLKSLTALVCFSFGMFFHPLLHHPLSLLLAFSLFSNSWSFDDSQPFSHS